jgi:ribosome-binding factor A
MPSYRLPRLASRIKFLVSSVIQREISDPRVGLVTVLRVDLAPDLTEATVFISIFGNAGSISRTLHALDDARGHIQKEVGKNLETRNTPRLRFVLDESQDKVSRIEALMVEAKEEPEDAMAKKPGKKDDKGMKASKSPHKAAKPEKKEEKGCSRCAPSKREEKAPKAGKSGAKPEVEPKAGRKFRPIGDDEGGFGAEKDFEVEDMGEEDKDFVEEEIDDEDEELEDDDLDEDEEEEAEDEEEEDEEY